ncbi:hypothetical protein Tco_0751252 [Tanacetum coccineum]|uniref:Uncharacterized protein n=1 Tax=Tanacetum coccineum TaxID=301880 RepID=A0ABQ4Z4N9_9ASTR
MKDISPLEIRKASTPECVTAVTFLMCVQIGEQQDEGVLLKVREDAADRERKYRKKRTEYIKPQDPEKYRLFARLTNYSACLVLSGCKDSRDDGFMLKYQIECSEKADVVLEHLGGLNGESICAMPYQNQVNPEDWTNTVYRLEKIPSGKTAEQDEYTL